MVKIRKKKLAICGFILALVSLIAWIRVQISYAYCSVEEAEQLLRQMCDEYDKSTVYGNLCADICLYKNVTFVECMNHFGAPKVVMKMKYHGKDAILKFDPTNVQRFDDNKLNSPSTVFSYKTSVVALFKELLSNKLSGDLEEVFHQIEPPGFGNIFSKHKLKSDEKDVPTVQQEAAMRSLWKLLFQDEYLLYRHLNGLNILPNLYGSCGGIYLVESAEPGRISGSPLDYLMVTKHDWNQRAGIALKLLKYLEDIEQLPEPLHFCDVTVSNFGLAADGTIRAIDVDTTFLDSKLNERFVADNFGQESNCTKHTDCGFGDCLGWCNYETGYCHSRRSNNNLQEICEDVFSSRDQNNNVGLLHSPPSSLSSKITNILAECSKPPPSSELPGCVKEDDGRVTCLKSDSPLVRYATGPEIKSKLEKILHESILTSE